MNDSKAVSPQQIILAWLPALVTMTLIFVLSAQPKYGAPTPVTTVYFSGAIPIFPGIWETVIKKGAHVLMFGSLALLSRRALLLEQVPPWQASLAAIGLTVLYALTDELHQQTVVGRSASLNDVGLDFAGAAVLVLGVELMGSLKRRHRS